MSTIIEKSLVIRKETIYEKIRKKIFTLIYNKDYQFMQELEELFIPKRPRKKVIIPQEIGRK